MPADSHAPVKVHKITLMVVDHDQIGVDQLQQVIENVNYPNDCCAPEVMAIESAEVDWTDLHKINMRATRDAALRELFPAGGQRAAFAAGYRAAESALGCDPPPAGGDSDITIDEAFRAQSAPPSAPEVEWIDDDGFVTARFGPLGIEIITLAQGGWAWSVMIGGVRQAHGGDMFTTLSEAQTAAIAAARAWRDSIKL